ncbi:MAG: tetratricopeptide repeat protein, partial [Rhodothermia bacterium]|nr:tetratricopeptide repeat protein [Rhodothermia bacterium]
NDFQKASDAYAMAIEVDPDHATAYSKKGHADTYLGAFEAARADFAAAEKVAKTLGQRVGQKNFAVYTHLYAGDVAAAMEANAEVIEGLKGNDSDEATGPLRTTYRDRVLIAAHHGMFDEAMDAYREIVGYTESVTARVNQPGWTTNMKAQDKTMEAFVAVKKGDIDRAKALAEEVKKLRADRNDPRKYEGYHRLVGLIALAEGDAEGAVSHLEQANMQSPLVKYELAEAHEAAGNQEKARALYQEVANYNFNSIGTAICRGMAKDKISA